MWHTYCFHWFAFTEEALLEGKTMKKIIVWGSATVLGAILTFGGVASAQDVTPVATSATQDTPVQRTQAVDDDNDFPWGVLGLLGLAGLAGLRRNPEPVRQETTRMPSGPGVYDNK
jgi:MYXO-CTERM domain-containing protein